MHIATSILWLGIASDRIRDYFALTYHGVIADQVTHKRGDSWAAPFCNAEGRDDEESAQLSQLVPLRRRCGGFVSKAITSHTRSQPTPHNAPTPSSPNNRNTPATARHTHRHPISALKSSNGATEHPRSERNANATCGTSYASQRRIGPTASNKRVRMI